MQERAAPLDLATLSIEPTRRPPDLGHHPDLFASLAAPLEHQRREHPDRLAVVDGEMELSYRELGNLVDRVADGLSRLGVGRGDVVLVCLPNWWETIVAFHAISRIGGVINPVVPIYREAELSFIVAQSRPAAVLVPGAFGRIDFVEIFHSIVERGMAPPSLPIVIVRGEEALGSGELTFKSLVMLGAQPPDSDAPSSSDIALLLYTSGTTADPKGVLHSHGALIYECRSIEQLFSLGTDDHVFMGSPLTHITGFLYGFILPALAARAVGLLDVWNPERAVDVIEAISCRFTLGATPFLRDITSVHKALGRPSSLRHFPCGGADVPPDLVEEATGVLQANVCRVYGSSEFPTVSVSRPSDGLDVKAHTDGFPIGPVEVRLDDEVDGVGQLLVKGPEMFCGYLDASLNDSPFTSEGWFRTGDLASIGTDGSLTIRGRAKDIVIRNGEKISAREIELLVCDHPGVEDVVVIPLTDEATGERVCVVAVAKRGAQITLEALVAHLERHGIVRQKLPEQLELVAELPRTASGKVQKHVLRDRFEDPSHTPAMRRER